MTRYLVSVLHPANYDPSLEDASMSRDISALNQEMIDAGVRLFVGGLETVKNASSLRPQSDGRVLVTSGPFAETSEHLGGFWVLEAASLDEALAWGRKAAIACRNPIEVRAFH